MTASPAASTSAPAAVIADGQAVLGIELGSTRIKAVLVGPGLEPIALGVHDWESRLEDGRWTYSLDEVETGLQACYADLVSDVDRRYGIRPTAYAAAGVSAMMHGYLAFDDADELLVPFRTWRNTSTGAAASRLTTALGVTIPLRWSIAHLYQAVLDDEEHIASVASLTTLAGYVHHRLTGERVLGVGDASGMFPIDPATVDYDAGLLDRAEAMIADHRPGIDLRRVLPRVIPAGHAAGTLTESGALLLDPTGGLAAGIPFCPPEGDAGTGMVASNAVAPRRGNVSVGTSVFAMVVLERELTHPHPEIDVVTTPVGDPVAMIHANNGASELGAWAAVFSRFADAIGSPAAPDEVYAALLADAIAAPADGGGLVAYNFLSGEPVAGVAEGRPMIVRTPDSVLTLGTLMRTQMLSIFATLALGMTVLADEGVELDALVGHGGLFRTPGAAQRLLAAALDVPVAVTDSAGEGGPWGMALLAAYLLRSDRMSLAEFLSRDVFAGSDMTSQDPDPEDVAGFAVFLERYRAGLDLQRVAAAAMRTGRETS